MVNSPPSFEGQRQVFQSSALRVDETAQLALTGDLALKIRWPSVWCGYGVKEIMANLLANMEIWRIFDGLRLRMWHPTAKRPRYRRADHQLWAWSTGTVGEQPEIQKVLCQNDARKSMVYPLVNKQFAIEHSTFIVDLPIKKWWFSIVIYVSLPEGNTKLEFMYVCLLAFSIPFQVFFCTLQWNLIVISRWTSGLVFIFFSLSCTVG